MSHKKIEMEGFVRDENGKWHTVPMKLPGVSSAQKSSVKKKQARKFIPIERLTPANFDPSPNEPKRRKIDKPIRKELFKVPQRKSDVKSARPSFSTRQSKNFKKPRMSNGNSTGMLKKSKQLASTNDASPLLDIDEAEELFINKKLSIKPLISPSSTVKNCTTVKGITPKKSVLIEQNMTPCTREFVQLEKTLATVSESTNETDSPMSSMCALLENAKINGSVNKGNSKQLITCLAEIKNILERDKQQFINYYTQHLENTNKVINLVTQLIDNEETKENKKRRSSRIAAQVTTTKEKAKFVISPAISKEDLRKTALNKNLTKVLQNDVQSSRTKKAVDMYNGMRTENGVLCTPRLDRKTLDIGQSTVIRSLSRRIQNQCLLLQDTPNQTEQIEY